MNSKLLLRKRPLVMGILNMTPDSLYASELSRSDSSADLKTLRVRIEKMIADGASIIDVGGESTAPGSSYIPANEEWERIHPALEILKELKKNGSSILISVDTYKSEVFKMACDYGVDMLNDITALRGDPYMVGLVAESRVKVCLMYCIVPLSAKESRARVTNSEVDYTDVIKTIGDFWRERINFATAQGIAPDKIILDPGMGAFVSGDPKYSFEVLNRFRELKDLFSKFPLLVGASRKGFTGTVRLPDGGFEKRLSVEDRLIPSLAAATLALRNGADILRVHDVKEMKQVVDFFSCFRA